MVDAPLPSFWPPAAAVAAPGQQQQEPPPPPTTVLCPGPSPPAGGRKRDREQPSLWPHGSSGETGAVVGAGRHARQGSTSSLANGLGGLELGLGAAEEEDGGEAEEEVEAAILTGQAIKRLRIEAPTSSFLSPPAFAAASAGYGGEQHVGPYDQHQGHAVPPSPLPPQPSSQVGLRSGWGRSTVCFFHMI